MEIRTINPKYRRIARRLISREPELQYIAESRVRIAFLESDAEKAEKGKLILGQCERVPEKFRWAVHYDFMITVFAPNVERFDRRQMEALLFHELLHVGIEQDGFEEKYSVVPHDFEEFRTIMERYGLDWSEEKHEQTGKAQKAGKGS